jgi:ABC-type transporter Mla subunit MlaD
MPVKLYAILGGVLLVLLVGALFYFAGQADGRKPAQIEVRVPATNVGVQAEPAGGANAPAQ